MEKWIKESTQRTLKSVFSGIQLKNEEELYLKSYIAARNRPSDIK